MEAKDEVAQNSVPKKQRKPRKASHFIALRELPGQEGESVKYESMTAGKSVKACKKNLEGMACKKNVEGMANPAGFYIFVCEHERVTVSEQKQLVFKKE